MRSLGYPIGQPKPIPKASQAQQEKFWREYYVYSASYTPLAVGVVGGNNPFVPFEVRIDAGAAFEFIKTIHRVTTPAAPFSIQSNNNFRIKYKDDVSGRNLMKASFYCTEVSGTAFAVTLPNGVSIDNCFQPFIWPRPYIIGSSATFTVEIADDSGISNNIYMSFHGNKIHDGIAPYKQKKYDMFVPYVYPLQNISNTQTPVAGTAVISANNTVSTPIPTDVDADFLVMKIVGRRTGAALVTIKDGTDRQWMDSPLHIDNLIGNGMFPNTLPSPRFIERGSVISTMIQDISNATNTIDLSFIGIKLYE